MPVPLPEQVAWRRSRSTAAMPSRARRVVCCRLQRTWYRRSASGLSLRAAARCAWVEQIACHAVARGQNASRYSTLRDRSARRPAAVSARPSLRPCASQLLPLVITLLRRASREHHDRGDEHEQGAQRKELRAHSAARSQVIVFRSTAGRRRKLRRWIESIRYVPSMRSFSCIDQRICAAADEHLPAHAVERCR